MSRVSRNIFLQKISDKLAEALYFYHMVPKDTDLGETGLISPEYTLQQKRDTALFRHMTDKYRNRLTGSWGIYPDRDPASLTDEEILSGLKQVRGTNGGKYIYFFKYAPTGKLGKNMKKVLSGKDIYKIDLNDPEVQQLVSGIDWGREGSVPTGKRLSKKYYKNVTPEEYFSAYDDNGTPLFSSLNHIAVATDTGTIPARLLKKI